MVLRIDVLRIDVLRMDVRRMQGRRMDGRVTPTSVGLAAVRLNLITTIADGDTWESGGRYRTRTCDP